MLRGTSGRIAVAIAAGLLAGCAPGARRESPRTVQVGHHQVKLVPPPGWEHLDHGRQQLFRSAEAEVMLEDFGPATPKGLATELREAEKLLHAGRRSDALARVRVLHGLPIILMPSPARAEFWKPWTDVTYLPDVAGDARLGRALRDLIRNAEALPEVSMDRIIEYVLMESGHDERREIARKETRAIHGAPWVWLETWDRTSHTYRHRFAFVEDQGYLLVLSTRRGLIRQTGAAFDTLLASIEV